MIVADARTWSSGSPLAFQPYEPARSARGRRYPTQARSTSPLSLCEAALSLLSERVVALVAISGGHHSLRGAGMPGAVDATDIYLSSLPTLI